MSSVWTSSAFFFILVFVIGGVSSKLFLVDFLSSPMGFTADQHAVALGLFMLALNGFLLSTAVSLSSMLHGYFPAGEDGIWRRIPPFSLIIPNEFKDSLTAPDAMPEIVQRAKAAHRNWTENAVLLALFFLIFSMSGADSATARALIYVAIAGRYIHSVTYIMGIGGVRTVGHLVAQICGIIVGSIGLKEIL